MSVSRVNSSSYLSPEGDSSPASARAFARLFPARPVSARGHQCLSGSWTAEYKNWKDEHD